MHARLVTLIRAKNSYSAALRPDINWMTKTTSASTSRTWMNPPNV
jgi:hypothetical protein